MLYTKQELRARIRTVNSTRKITSAMEMIANVKLLKQRKLMENNREYAQILQDTVNEIVAKNPEVENPFLSEKKSPKKLTILFSSDLGLCGAYNSNTMKLAERVLEKSDPMIVIGTELYRQLVNRGFNVINEPTASDKVSFLDIKKFVEQGVQMYLRDEVSAVQLLYTMFVNTMTFRPMMDTLLPCIMKQQEEKPETAGMHVETLFEPDADTILSQLIPMMIDNVTYADWLETKTAEQGSRRVAMKIATDNADQLSDALKLEYNKARQASITQEITEIIGGSAAV